MVCLGLLVGLIGAVIAHASWFPAWTPTWYHQVVAHFPASDCDALLQPCMTQLPSGERISLFLNATALSAMLPVEIRVVTQNIPARSASISFTGIHMFMGDNTPILVEQSPGIFVGKIVLPICAQEAMIWRASIVLHTQRGLIEAPFQFTVHRSPS